MFISSHGECDVLLSTSSFVQLWRVAERGLHAHRWLSSKVVVAVAGLSDEAVAADDYVGLEGVAGAVDGVGDVALPGVGCWVAGGVLV